MLSRTTSSATFYYHYDGNGNVVSLTDDSENVVATYEYDAYGNLQASTGAEANNNPFRFNSKYFDSSGFYDFGFRFYDPVMGRWLNRDPIGENGGLNLYGFVGNSPGNFVDPYGEDFYRWLYTGNWNASDEVYNAALNGGASALHGTISLGVSASGMLGYGASLSAQGSLGWNEKTGFSCGVLGSAGFLSGVGAGLGLGAFVQQTNAGDVRMLTGEGYKVGGSLPFEISPGYARVGGKGYTGNEYNLSISPIPQGAKGSIYGEFSGTGGLIFDSPNYRFR